MAGSGDDLQLNGDLGAMNAQLRGVLQLRQVAFINVTVDPTVGAGVPAPIGSLAVNSAGGIWQKTGAGDTAWTVVSGTTGVQGRYLGRQRFTANGTYTPTTGARRVRFRIVGGGGGGGGVSAHATEYTQSGGGCSGTYVEHTVFAAGGITGGAVTIGAAGAAGSGTGPTSGGTGGSSSVVIQGVTYTVPGGLGGGAADGSAGIGIASGGQPNGAPPAGVDLVVVGYGEGVANRVVKSANAIASAGWGGSTPFGSPANPGQRMSGTTQTPGNAPGDSYGYGGSGTTGDNSAGAGKSGGAGLLIIDEWT